jgi:hypothetical protein
MVMIKGSELTSEWVAVEVNCGVVNDGGRPKGLKLN